MHTDFEWELNGIRTDYKQIMNRNRKEQDISLNGQETKFLACIVAYPSIDEKFLHTWNL